jgi:ribosomal protein L40E
MEEEKERKLDDVLGWICARCGASNAPTVPQCPSCSGGLRCVKVVFPESTADDRLELNVKNWVFNEAQY